MAGLCHRKMGEAICEQTLEDTLRVLEALADEGEPHKTWLRVGQGLNGALYLDLCNSAWQIVEITASGWGVVDRAPKKMLRLPAMRPLPKPKGGDGIERLREFVNVATEDDFVLIASWLVAALRPDLPMPVLVTSGEQGSGKGN
jgi:putative DNA primase/helicase